MASHEHVNVYIVHFFAVKACKLNEYSIIICEQCSHMSKNEAIDSQGVP